MTRAVTFWDCPGDSSIPENRRKTGITYHTLDLFFVSICAEEPRIHARDEVKDFRWLPRSALPLEQFAFSSMRKALAAYLQSSAPNPTV